MLGFLFHKKREEVQRVLHGRVNRAHARTISAENLRSASRGVVTEVVWVIPCNSVSDVDHSCVFPAVTKDMSTEGISIIHNAPITTPRVIIGLKDETDRRFLACTLKHSTKLGYGLYHIGLHADEVLVFDEAEVEEMQKVLKKFESLGANGRSSGSSPIV